MYSLLAFVFFAFWGGVAIKETVSHFYNKETVSDAQTLLDVYMDQDELIRQARAKIGALIKIRSRNT